MSATVSEPMARLISLMPRYPEEGGDASSVHKEDIAKALSPGNDTQQQVAIRTTLELIETLLSRLSLLDMEALQTGHWKFVSHPAQLCALSVLNSLADSRQRMFPPGFWQTTGVGDKEKEEQKRVLRAMEDRRKAHHLDADAKPIRFIYVAWGIIKLEGKYLFYEAEAREHRREYGLIGGRVNLSDLRHVVGENFSLPERLAVLQSAHSSLMFEAMPYAMARELEEECGLLSCEPHYQAEPWRDLTPWQDCMGGAPNYALTQYFFRLYHIRLTVQGFLALRKRLLQPESGLLEWNLDEVVAGKTHDGSRTLRFDAIYADFGNDRSALEGALRGLPESHENRYRYVEERDALIFSLENNVLQGDAGKEKPFLAELTGEQKSILMGFAAHAKGCAISTETDRALTFHEHGWIEIHDSVLMENVIKLSDNLRRKRAPIIDVIDGTFCRLSVAKNNIFFDPKFFSYELDSPLVMDENKTKFTLIRLPIPTTFGIAGEGKCSHLPATRLAEQLQELAKGDVFHYAQEEYEHWPRNIRSALQPMYRSLGLRTLLVTKGKYYQFSCAPRAR
ncbi:MAG: hypothetical protein U1E83_11790 [Methylotetracoccus sp.]